MVCARTFEEELRGFFSFQWLEPPHNFPLDPERLTAGSRYPHTEAALAHRPYKLRAALDQVLAVVQNEQQLALRQVAQKRNFGASVQLDADSQARRNCRRHQIRFGHRRQVHEPDSVDVFRPELARHFEHKTGLTNATWTNHRNEAALFALQRLAYTRDIARPANQSSMLDWQVGLASCRATICAGVAHWTRPGQHFEVMAFAGREREGLRE